MIGSEVRRVEFRVTGDAYQWLGETVERYAVEDPSTAYNALLVASDVIYLRGGKYPAEAMPSAEFDALDVVVSVANRRSLMDIIRRRKNYNEVTHFQVGPTGSPSFGHERRSKLIHALLNATAPLEN